MPTKTLVCVKDLFHIRPPFAFAARFKWLLHGLHNGPPLLGFRIGSHVCHISSKVTAVVFEVAEQSVILQKYRIVADITLMNHLENLRPDGGVISFVFLDGLWPHVDD